MIPLLCSKLMCNLQMIEIMLVNKLLPKTELRNHFVNRRTISIRAPIPWIHKTSGKTHVSIGLVHNSKTQINLTHLSKSFTSSNMVLSIIGPIRFEIISGVCAYPSSKRLSDTLVCFLFFRLTKGIVDRSNTQE